MRILLLFKHTLRNRKIRAKIRLHILYRKKNEIIKPSIKIKKKRINTLNTKVLKWKQMKKKNGESELSRKLWC